MSFGVPLLRVFLTAGWVRLISWISCQLRIKNQNFSILRSNIKKKHSFCVLQMYSKSQISLGFSWFDLSSKNKLIACVTWFSYRMNWPRPVSDGVWLKSSRIHRCVDLLEYWVPERCYRWLGTNKCITNPKRQIWNDSLYKTNHLGQDRSDRGTPYTCRFRIR